MLHLLYPTNPEIFPILCLLLHITMPLSREHLTPVDSAGLTSIEPGQHQVFQQQHGIQRTL